MRQKGLKITPPSNFAELGGLLIVNQILVVSLDQIQFYLMSDSENAYRQYENLLDKKKGQTKMI